MHTLLSVNIISHESMIPENHQEPLQFGVSLQAGVRGSFLYGVFFQVSVVVFCCLETW